MNLLRRKQQRQGENCYGNRKKTPRNFFLLAARQIASDTHFRCFCAHLCHLTDTDTIRQLSTTSTAKAHTYFCSNIYCSRVIEKKERRKKRLNRLYHFFVTTQNVRSARTVQTHTKNVLNSRCESEKSVIDKTCLLSYSHAFVVYFMCVDAEQAENERRSRFAAYVFVCSATSKHH